MGTDAARRRVRTRLIALAAAVLVLAIASLFVGSSHVSYASLVSSKADGAVARDIVFGLRLPRTLAAAAVGALLALSGALLQVLLRNPIADPYVLGVSGGASVGALLALLVGGVSALVTPAAIVGAALATVGVFVLAREDRSRTQSRLLLTGVAFASFSGAIVALLLSLAPDGILRGIVFWLLGDLSGATAWPAAIALAIGLPAALAVAHELDMIAFGRERAASLGVSVDRLRHAIYLAAAAMTAIAVTTAGAIGFVGLVVPHMMRLLVGSSHRRLLPAAALGGAAMLMLADLVARAVIAPAQLPVGVVTAIVGAPVFVWLLGRGARRA